MGTLPALRQLSLVCMILHHFTIHHEIPHLVTRVLFLSRLLPSADKTNNTHPSSPPSSGGDGPEFATVFVLASVGSMVVTANTQLLGGSISFFQSLCVLGYCVLPLFFSLCGCRILMLIFSDQTGFPFGFLFRFILVIAALSWSIFGISLLFLPFFFVKFSFFQALFQYVLLCFRM